ncbi:MAG: pirin family protein [Proteobacteria bacterium]|nr:pirin family protein [Pseudomonadota bacterium]
MSIEDTFHPEDPALGDRDACDLIEQIIIPRTSDLGGLPVRRALPVVGRRMVGPFVFLDEMGPAEFRLGEGLDIRPHPHIGLSTVTYLFDGALMHRDSLGSEQEITPGGLNIMQAGRGIAHSERTTAEARARGARLSGVQLWAALPKSHEEADPAFTHFEENALPRLAGEGKRVRLLMGTAFGAVAPSAFPYPALLAEAIVAPGSILPIDPDYEERALYIVSGEIDIAGDTFGPGRLLVLRAGERISVLGLSNARLVLLGGEPLDGPRHLWWNFVSSSKDRIEAAKADWAAGKFDAVPGESEFIPLPKE